jgi:hypothetical protein
MPEMAFNWSRISGILLERRENLDPASEVVGNQGIEKTLLGLN